MLCILGHSRFREVHVATSYQLAIVLIHRLHEYKEGIYRTMTIDKQSSSEYQKGNHRNHDIEVIICIQADNLKMS